MSEAAFLVSRDAYTVAPDLVATRLNASKNSLERGAYIPKELDDRPKTLRRGLQIELNILQESAKAEAVKEFTGEIRNRLDNLELRVDTLDPAERNVQKLADENKWLKEFGESCEAITNQAWTHQETLILDTIASFEQLGELLDEIAMKKVIKAIESFKSLLFVFENEWKKVKYVEFKDYNFDVPNFLHRKAHDLEILIPVIKKKNKFLNLFQGFILKQFGKDFTAYLNRDALRPRTDEMRAVTRDFIRNARHQNKFDDIKNIQFPSTMDLKNIDIDKINDFISQINNIFDALPETPPFDQKRKSFIDLVRFMIELAYYDIWEQIRDVDNLKNLYNLLINLDSVKQVLE